MVTDIELKPGADLRALADQLEQLAFDAENLLANKLPLQVARILDDYLQWAADTFAQLRNSLERGQAEDLVFTPHYWALRTQPGKPTDGLLRAELYDRAAAFREFASGARSARRRWAITTGMIVIPDTNVYLHQPEMFNQIDWPAVLSWQGPIYLVVPIVVVHELDKQERGRQEVRTRARITLRELEDQLSADASERVPLTHKGVALPNVWLEALVDDLRHEPLPSPDAEIVDRAAYVQRLSGARVKVVTGDGTMRLLARSVGLEVLTLPD